MDGTAAGTISRDLEPVGYEALLSLVGGKWDVCLRYRMDHEPGYGFPPLENWIRICLESEVVIGPSAEGRA